MKHRLPLISVLLLVAMGLFAKGPYSSEHIVGYVSNEVKIGLNEIEVKMDSLDIFPTLDRVLAFSPPASIIGDELIVDLDGTRRSFVFEALIGSNYVLRANFNACPNLQRIELDWIPLRSRFWLRHVSTNRVMLINVGQLSEEDFRKMCRREIPIGESIKVRYIGDDGSIQDLR